MRDLRNFPLPSLGNALKPMKKICKGNQVREMAFLGYLLLIDDLNAFGMFDNPVESICENFTRLLIRKNVELVILAPRGLEVTHCEHPLRAPEGGHSKIARDLVVNRTAQFERKYKP